MIDEDVKIEEAGSGFEVEKDTEREAESGALGAPEIESWLVERLAALIDLEPDEIDVRTPVERFGLDSRTSVGMTGELEDWLGIELPATLLWDYPTIAEASAYLAKASKLAQRRG